MTEKTSILPADDDSKFNKANEVCNFFIMRLHHKYPVPTYDVKIFIVM